MTSINEGRNKIDSLDNGACQSKNERSNKSSPIGFLIVSLQCYTQFSYSNLKTIFVKPNTETYHFVFKQKCDEKEIYSPDAYPPVRYFFHFYKPPFFKCLKTSSNLLSEI